MCEENLMVEEVKQEENLPASEAIEAQTQEAEIVPESEAPEQAELTSSVPEEPVLQAEAPAADTAAAPEEAPASQQSKDLPYHERYYLKYRDAKRSTPLDLKGTRSFLQTLGIDGGELRQAREGKTRAEALRNADKNSNTQMFCSYCGTEISGVEYSRLPDGRLRCTACTGSVIKTKAEAEELCRRVIDHMANFFGAVLEVPVSVEIVEARKLRKKLGGRLERKDLQSILVLGAALKKKKKYSIILENGAPRISTIATFAHELTHIWQYTHWTGKPFKRCSKRKHLLLYEGMAKWAEIQYLYLIGEANVARHEENIVRNRQDEYGIGFRVYEDHYPLSRGAMSCEDTPFTPDCYPIE